MMGIYIYIYRLTLINKENKALAKAMDPLSIGHPRGPALDTHLIVPSTLHVMWFNFLECGGLVGNHY